MLTRADLHPYQNEAIQLIREHKRLAVWMPMGGGKSVSTLTALDDLSLTEDCFPALIIAPLRVARSTWPTEVESWSHISHLTISPIIGTAEQRKRALRKPADIHTINFDNLVWLLETLGDERPFKTIVVDEASRLASYRTRQGSVRMRALAKMAWDAERFIELTGSPGANGIKNLWGQSWFLDKGARLGSSFSAFTGRWFKLGYDGFTLEPMAHAQKEIQDKLKDVAFTIDLPPADLPIQNVIKVELPSKARELYKQLEKHFFMELATGEVEAANAAVKTMKLLQLANGAVFVDDERNWEAVHDAKLDALDSIITEANGQPVLVAYQFTHDIERIQKRFKQARLLKTKADEDAWNRGEIEVMMAHEACLHPSTEVLTELRGWVKIVDVKNDERVFDGIEFVSHSGCRYEGVRPVLHKLGLTLTPNHRILIDGTWVRAEHVRDCEGTRRKARYAYTGDDPRLGALLPLWRRADVKPSEYAEGQPCRSGVVPFLPQSREISHDDRHSVLANLEEHGKPGDQPRRQGFRALRRGWTWGRERVAGFQELLSRYVLDVSRRPNDRPTRQLAGVFPGKLPLGFEYGAAVKQEQQSRHPLSGARHALSRVLPHCWRIQRGHIGAPKQRDDSGRGARSLQQFGVQEEPEIEVSEVYDLIDCGPRSRFVVRNPQGEVFISHNSAGHGLNLQHGGNIIVRFGLSWSLEGYEQIVERIGPRRQKQSGYDRPVFEHIILAADTMDEVVFERLTSKRSIQDILLEAMKVRGVAPPEPRKKLSLKL